MTTAMNSTVNEFIFIKSKCLYTVICKVDMCKKHLFYSVASTWCSFAFENTFQ